MLEESRDALKKKVEELSEEHIKELGDLKSQHLKKIQELKESKEFEVDTLSAQLTKRDLMIKELKNGLGESQNVRKSTIA
jgi:hypothetical protein